MTQLLRPFELDPFDLLWRNLQDTQSHFSAITQKVTHPVDIFETEDGIVFEVAAVGLAQEDIEILIEGDMLRIRYEGKQESRPAIYRGIKRSGFDLSWKISTKFDLTQLVAALDKGLLILGIPVAEGQAVRRVLIATPQSTIDQQAPQLESKKKK
jgi:HSP20 family molecular chaperone IbpA